MSRSMHIKVCEDAKAVTIPVSLFFPNVTPVQVQQAWLDDTECKVG